MTDAELELIRARRKEASSDILSSMACVRLVHEDIPALIAEVERLRAEKANPENMGTWKTLFREAAREAKARGEEIERLRKAVAAAYPASAMLLGSEHPDMQAEGERLLDVINEALPGVKK